MVDVPVHASTKGSRTTVVVVVVDVVVVAPRKSAEVLALVVAVHPSELNEPLTVAVIVDVKKMLPAAPPRRAAAPRTHVALEL